VSRANRRPIAVGGAVGIAVLVAAGFLWAKQEGEDDRQAEVARRGAEVMSFDLETTTHVFEARRDGGVQTVVADDPRDDGGIREIRGHLRAEATAFRRGRFGDPARIHGAEMPGLAELEAGYRRVAIRYEDVSDGGRIRYATEDPDLVRAIHAWFRAQVSDHGEHAREGS
jgi:hypothetical protein